MVTVLSLSLVQTMVFSVKKLFWIFHFSVYSDPTVHVTKIQEVAIGNFIPHPATVTAIALTSITGIRTETGEYNLHCVKYCLESVQYFELCLF